MPVNTLAHLCGYDRHRSSISKGGKARRLPPPPTRPTSVLRGGADPAPVVGPSLNDAPGLSQAGEPARVEAFLAEAAVEALDRAVLHRLARVDEEQLHAVLVSPAIEVAAAKFRPVVDRQHVRVAAFGADLVEHANDPGARQRKVDQDRRALARAVVLQVGGAELAPAGEAILGEVERPALVGGDRAPMTRHRATPALPPATAADGQLLLAIQPLDELVGHPPALAAQQRVQPPIAEPPPLAGEGAKPLAQTLTILDAFWRSLHRRARDPDQPAGPTARQPMLLLGDRHRPPAVAPQASPVFCQQPLERLVIEHGIGQQLLEAAAVLLLQRLQ